MNAPERIEVHERGPEHVTRFAYYGGCYDGRVSAMDTMSEADMGLILMTVPADEYTVTRYAVHADTKTLCWVLFMHTPIAEKGNL